MKARIQASMMRLTPILISRLTCRRLTEELTPKGQKNRLLLLLDEFPALGRLDFFETALGLKVIPDIFFLKFNVLLSILPEFAKNVKLLY